MTGIGALAVATGVSATLAACGSPARHVASAPKAAASGSVAQPTKGPGKTGHGPASRRPRAGVWQVPVRRGMPAYASLPLPARPADTSHPTHVIGDGSPASCTSRGVVAAVTAGGVITFSCGPRPVTITMTTTATVRAHARVVLDGGGKVTLSGGGVRRILYMNCGNGHPGTTTACQGQAGPQLTVQNLTLKDGNSTWQHIYGGGGGAIFDRGGQLTVINSLFVGNRCDATGPDLGGAAIRVLGPYRGRPVYIVHSTFRGGLCSNGGALSSVGASWVVLDSVLTNNWAIGWGANPPRRGTPGGGSGGAIYTDGDQYTVQVTGSVIALNHAKEGGGGIFFVSGDRTGTLRISGSRLRHNSSAGSQTAGYPGIFFLGQGHPQVTASTIS